MTYSRYRNREKFKNNLEMFRDHFDARDVSYINQYVTPVFGTNDIQTFDNIRFVSHTWKAGDRLYKLSYEHYNDSQLWWIIAWFNKKPTESHFVIGDQVFIPKPLDKILQIIGV